MKDHLLLMMAVSMNYLHLLLWATPVLLLIVVDYIQGRMVSRMDRFDNFNKYV